MINPSLDRLYFTLDKSIRLVESYSEISELATVIKSCRLKPETYLFGKREDKIQLYRWWVDEFGNSIKLINKKAKIIFGDLSNKPTICTDLYYGLSLEKTIKMSKVAYLRFGIDEDLGEEFVFLTLVGIDNYFRSFVFQYGEWEVIPSLYLGLDNLRFLAQNMDYRYYHQVAIKKNCALPCQGGEAWITCLPALREFLDLMRQSPNAVAALFNKSFQ